MDTNISPLIAISANAARKKKKKTEKESTIALRSINRDYTIRRRDGNEHVKNSNRFYKIDKTTAMHVHLTFLYISLPFLHDYDVKLPDFTF